jgi:hypothetical protein
MLISLSPFDELIRSLCAAHISLRKSESQANTNLSIARVHDDEEDHMTFQSHNPATGELIGTYPEHDEAETNVCLQGRGVLPYMMELMNAITPFMKQPRHSRPRHHERRLSLLNATAWAQALERSY